MADVKELARLIDLIARKVPGGLLALRGKQKAPTRADLELTRWRPSCDSVHVSHDAVYDAVAEQAVDNVVDFGILDEVPWSAITAAVQWYSTSPLYKRDWDIYVEYVRLNALPRSYGIGGISDILAECHDLSPRTVYRICKRVPESVAQLVILGAVLLQDEP